MLPGFVFSQVEVNVKLKSGQQELQQFFAVSQAVALRQGQVPPALLQRYPFLTDFRQAQALLPLTGPALNPGLEKIYTLKLAGRSALAEFNKRLASGAF